VIGRHVALAVVLACLVSACTGTTGPVPLTPAPSSSARAFTFAMSGDAAALDPWNVVDDNSLQANEQIFESLVTYDTQSFEIRPSLAVSWQVSADKKQWTFKLRDGVKFHDGTDFNSDAVVFNFDRARLTKFKYRNSRPIADDYNYYQSMWGGFDDDSIITKVDAFDRLTVRFITKVPYGPFLPTLAMATFGIVSPASIKADPDGWMLPSSQSAAGTGPFMYTPGAWRKDDQLLLVRNPSYWRTDEKGVRLPYLERVLLRAIPDTGNRLAALRSGQIHAMRDFTPHDLPILKAEPKINLLDRAPNNIGYLRLNTHQPPLDNPDVRKAIAMAIDQEAMVSQVFAGFAAPATQFLPPGMLGYDDGTRVFQSYDPAGARRLLDIANVRDLQIELWYMPIARAYFPEPRKAAEAIAADLTKVGITVLLNTVDFTTYRDKFKRNEFQAWLYGWTGDNGDPDNFLCVFFCNTTQNGRWDDATAQQAVRLIKDAATDTEPLRRGDLYRQASRLIQRGVPAIPIVHADVPVAVSRTVSGYVPHPKGSEVFTFVQLGR
jgi:peptide/nickel transport system substrate-binding protein